MSTNPELFRKDDFEELFLRSAIGIVFVSSENRIVQANTGFCNLIDHSEPELIDMMYPILINSEDQNRFSELCQKLLTHEIRSFEIEKRLRHRSGSDVWVRATASLIRESTSHETIVLFAQECTGSKRIEEEMRDKEACLRAVLNTAIDAVITIDELGTIESINKATEKMFGYDSSELLGKNIKILMPAPYRQQHDEYLSRYVQTGTKHVIGIGREVTGLRKDGSTFPIELAIGESPEGTRRWFTGFLRDISDRKRNELQLREQADLLDRVTEAIIVRDQKDNITYWNKGAERLYGWTSEEVLNRPAIDVLGSAVNIVRKAELRLAKTGEWSGEFRHHTKSGRSLIVESHWTLIRDEDGNPVGKVAINIDATEKRALETRSRRAQRLESIGTLTSGIAHDLNNVLTPVLMAVKLLRRDKPGIDRRAILETANSSLDRGVTLIRQLLTFAGGIDGERSPVDLNQVVNEVTALLRQTLPKKIMIRTELEPELWPVLGDATQLSQVVMNLCVNARDAMPNGGEIEVSVENKVLNGEMESLYPGAKPGPYVVLAVTDTGTGIAPEIQDKMFDPFFTTKPFGHGTGLGLSTTLGIARSHNGFVNVYSEPGRGARLSVYLPAADRTIQSIFYEIETPETGSGEWILIVDDEQSILSTAKMVLEESGYQVLCASRGGDAIELFRKHADQISLVIQDMMMPGMDGLSVMKEIRSIREDALIVAASGLRPVGRTAEAVSAYANAFLQKPFTDNELLCVVASTRKQGS